MVVACTVGKQELLINQDLGRVDAPEVSGLLLLLDLFGVSDLLDILFELVEAEVSVGPSSSKLLFVCFLCQS